MTWPMCCTSRRVPWKALLAVTALKHFADGLNAAFARGLGALDHQGRGAHAHDQAVTAAVEGNGGVFHHFVGGGGPAGQEAGAEPLHQVVGGDVVGRDNDHAAAASGADPVLAPAPRLAPWWRRRS